MASHPAACARQDNWPLEASRRVPSQEVAAEARWVVALLELLLRARDSQFLAPDFGQLG